MQINNDSLHNNAKQLLHVFDVDGTLTHHDSFLLLVKFLVPSVLQRLLFNLSMVPAAVAALLTNKPEKLKLAMLQNLWQNQSEEKINTTCQRFFNEKLRLDLRLSALSFLRKLRKDSPDVQIVLLSASCNAWLQPLAAYLHASLICTQLQYDKNRIFAGHFASPNCKGQEKVRQLLQVYPPDEYRFICYADSPTDKYLQTISEQFFYRYF